MICTLKVESVDSLSVPTMAYPLEDSEEPGWPNPAHGVIDFNAVQLALHKDKAKQICAVVMKAEER